MVARMMRWPPWPQPKKFHVTLLLRRLHSDESEEESSKKRNLGEFAAEVRWKGAKTALSPLRRPSVQRNYTAPRPGGLDRGSVEWNEEFRCVCCLAPCRGGAYHPWEIALSLLHSSGGSPGRKMSVVGFASINLSDLVSGAEGQEIPLTVPLRPPAASAAGDTRLSLQISLTAVELRPAQESAAARSVVPAPLSPSPTTSSTPPAEPRTEVSALKAGLRRVKILTDLVSSARWSSKRGDGSGRSDDGEQSPSPRAFADDIDEDDEPGDGNDDDLTETESVQKSFSYGSLATANILGGPLTEDWVYYSGDGCRRSDVAPPSPSGSGRRGGLIPWKKRKLSFRSSRPRGEPLLKRAYAEDGGDDIDHDRRQLSSSDGETSARSMQVGGDFGDEGDRFEVGRWEEKEVTSRDGRMKLLAQVFFASMDQRSEEAGGEGACTTLAAVISDWLLRAEGDGAAMPIKSQFDSLIREGSREWRRLCDDADFCSRFPDRHLDLDAVLQAGVRPLALDPAKSFVGFFRPDDDVDSADNDTGKFSFLSGAMTFDSIWEEVSRAAGVYVVSWNDHFFVLKAEEDAYYVIDTLGERLHEGCAQAFILKFDKAASISRMSAPSPPLKADNTETTATVAGPEEVAEVVGMGRECCKEYIKSFLAAIPVRELRDEVSKGLAASAAAAPLHQRLQIEFHFAQPLSSPPSSLPPS